MPGLLPSRFLWARGARVSLARSRRAGATVRTCRRRRTVFRPSSPALPLPAASRSRVRRAHMYVLVSECVSRYVGAPLLDVLGSTPRRCRGRAADARSRTRSADDAVGWVLRCGGAARPPQSVRGGLGYARRTDGFVRFVGRDLRHPGPNTSSVLPCKCVHGGIVCCEEPSVAASGRRVCRERSARHEQVAGILMYPGKRRKWHRLRYDFPGPGALRSWTATRYFTW